MSSLALGAHTHTHTTPHRHTLEIKSKSLRKTTALGVWGHLLHLIAELGRKQGQVLSRRLRQGNAVPDPWLWTPSCTQRRLLDRCPHPHPQGTVQGRGDGSLQKQESWGLRLSATQGSSEDLEPCSFYMTQNRKFRSLGVRP